MLVSTVGTGIGHTLAEYTTLRLGGPATRLAVAASAAEAVDTVGEADRSGTALLLLGGGSNLVVGDDGFDGTALRIANRGVEFTRDGDCVAVDLAAGEGWDDVVARTIGEGFGGLECLSGIPGQVGATPIQNVGAYGCEISELLLSARVYDRAIGSVAELAPADLGFTYRNSVLKGTERGVVLSVRLLLRCDGMSMPIRYAELARVLGVEIGARVPAPDARAAVLDLRSGKGMVLDPSDHDTWSAGSFFTNPIVADGDVDTVLARIRDVLGDDVRIPRFPATGGNKLSAAWLIERAGFSKGYGGVGGRARLSTKHTLAVTNRGAASTADLLALAREVRDGVAQRFGITLRPEPLLVNCVL